MSKDASEDLRRVLGMPEKPKSVVLARLIAEVNREKAAGPNAYNRTHNRHMRSGVGFKSAAQRAEEAKDA